MLSKSEVYQLLWGLAQQFPKAADAFKACIKCKPSADLWGKGDEQTDEGELKKWLGVNFTYGRVDPETGEIQSYGTIERVSRFLDWSNGKQGGNIGEILFGKSEWIVTEAELLSWALESGYFPGFSTAEIGFLLGAAQRAEKATRHKANDNIPTLGTRQELVETEILSNDLQG
jgi:hypothetical protein